MSVNLKSLFSGSNFLHYSTTTQIVREVVRQPKIDENDLIQKIKQLKVNSTVKTTRIKFLWQKLCLLITCTFSSTYRKNLSKSLTKIKTVIEKEQTKETAQKAAEIVTKVPIISKSEEEVNKKEETREQKHGDEPTGRNSRNKTKTETESIRDGKTTIQETPKIPSAKRATETGTAEIKTEPETPEVIKETLPALKNEVAASQTIAHNPIEKSANEAQALPPKLDEPSEIKNKENKLENILDIREKLAVLLEIRSILEIGIKLQAKEMEVKKIPIKDSNEPWYSLGNLASMIVDPIGQAHEEIEELKNQLKKYNGQRIHKTLNENEGKLAETNLENEKKINLLLDKERKVIESNSILLNYLFKKYLNPIRTWAKTDSKGKSAVKTHRTHRGEITTLEHILQIRNQLIGLSGDQSTLKNMKKLKALEAEAAKKSDHHDPKNAWTLDKVISLVVDYGYSDEKMDEIRRQINENPNIMLINKALNNNHGDIGKTILEYGTRIKTLEKEEELLVKQNAELLNYIFKKYQVF